MTEYHKKNAYPHLWLWDENLLRTKGSVEVEAIMAKLCRQTLPLLENSALVVWLIQFENPVKAKAELGTAVCSFWDNIYEVIKGKPLLYVNLFSAKSMESMGIGYERFLAAFSDAVNVDYEKVKKTGSSIRAGLEGRRLIKVTDPNGTSLSFSIENRRVGTEIGTLEDCFSTGRECEVEIPAGEVYVAPLEDSSCGRLVVDEIRDFGVKKLEMHIENGRIVDLRAEKSEAEFRDFLENAQGNKDIVAEFGMGINHGMKPIGLRICDEKALGTVHIARREQCALGRDQQSINPHRFQPVQTDRGSRQRPHHKRRKDRRDTNVIDVEEYAILKSYKQVSQMVYHS